MLPLPTRPPDCLLLLLLLLLVVGRQTERFQAALGSVPRYKAHGYVTNYLILQREQPSEFIGEERDEKGRGVAEKEGRRGEGRGLGGSMGRVVCCSAADTKDFSTSNRRSSRLSGASRNTTSPRCMNTF